MKIYKHTGKLIPSTTKPHVAEPYARIGDENRCAVCGDIIEEDSVEKVKPISEEKLMSQYRALMKDND
jgi:hypothetical protein